MGSGYQTLQFQKYNPIAERLYEKHRPNDESNTEFWRSFGTVNYIIDGEI